MKSDTWKRAEAKRLQAEIERVKAMRKALAPKASGSGWDDPTFGDRVLARAERYNKLILAMDNPVPEPMEPAEAKWAKLIEKIMQDEQVDRPAALKIAKERRPDILQAMVREANKAGR